MASIISCQDIPRPCFRRCPGGDAKMDSWLELVLLNGTQNDTFTGPVASPAYTFESGLLG